MAPSSCTHKQLRVSVSFALADWSFLVLQARCSPGPICIKRTESTVWLSTSGCWLIRLWNMSHLAQIVPSLQVAVSVPAKASSGQAQDPVEVRSFKLGHVSASPETVPTLPLPIILQTTGPFQYYEAPKAFSITGLIQQNKMILFMVLGLGFAIGMPKLLVSSRFAVHNNSRGDTDGSF